MTTSGQIKCPSCGGSIGLTCHCRSVRLSGRVHGSGRFEGPIEISEKQIRAVKIAPFILCNLLGFVCGLIFYRCVMRPILFPELVKPAVVERQAP